MAWKKGTKGGHSGARLCDGECVLRHRLPLPVLKQRTCASPIHPLCLGVSAGQDASSPWVCFHKRWTIVYSCEHCLMSHIFVWERPRNDLFPCLMTIDPRRDIVRVITLSTVLSARPKCLYFRAANGSGETPCIVYLHPSVKTFPKRDSKRST